MASEQARASISAATSRSEALAGASSNAIGMPSEAHACRRRRTADTAGTPRSSGCGWRSSRRSRSRRSPSVDGLARGADGDRRGVKQPDPVAPGRRHERDRVQQPHDLRRQRAHPLVVARLLGQIRKQVPQPAHREAQEPPLGRDVEQDLRDRQAHQLSVGDLWAASCARSSRQDFISQHVKSDQQGVEIGGHAATSGSTLDRATPTFDTLQSNVDLRHPSYVSSTPSRHPTGTESLI